MLSLPVAETDDLEITVPLGKYNIYLCSYKNNIQIFYVSTGTDTVAQIGCTAAMCLGSSFEAIKGMRLRKLNKAKAFEWLSSV